MGTQAQGEEAMLQIMSGTRLGPGSEAMRRAEQRRVTVDISLITLTP